MTYLYLFLVFFRLGFIGFGGGYAMLSQIRHDVVVSHVWMSDAEFTDLVAVSQITPGPISINCATYVGYVASGNIAGAILASLALCLPSVMMVWALLYALKRYARSQGLILILSAIRPIAIGLIAAAALVMMTPENFVDYKAILIGVLSFVACFFFKVNPIIVMIGAGLLGYLLW